MTSGYREENHFTTRHKLQPIISTFFSQRNKKTDRKIPLERKGFFAIHFQNSL